MEDVTKDFQCGVNTWHIAGNIQWHRARSVIGTPETVIPRLQEIQAQFAADELMVITVTGDYASRLRSYQLLAETWPKQTVPNFHSATV